MAKKQKVVIVNEELTPTVLATLKDKKKTNIFGIIWLFIIFSIFIAGVYFLPDLSTYVNSYLNPEPVSSTTTKPNVKKDEEQDEKTEVKEYKISENPEIVEEKFTVNNIKIENQKILLNIKNTGKDTLEISNMNYFINLFDGNKKLVQRIRLKWEMINPEESIQLSYDLVNSSVSFISIMVIKQEEYPNFVATQDEYKNATLACKKETETINYMLSNNKLTGIQDVFEILSTDSNYAAYYNNYQMLANNYNNIAGVSSVVNLESDKFIFTTTINLNAFKEGTLNSNFIYAKDTDAKIMKFEMEASGYTCN